MINKFLLGLFGKVPLRMLLIVPFVLQIVGAVGLVGYFSYSSGQKALEDLANQLMDQSTKRVKDHLDNSLQILQQTVAINYNAVQQNRLNINDFEQIRQHLWQQINLNPTLATTSYISEQGKLITYGRILNQELVELFKKKTVDKNSYQGKLFLAQTDPIQTQIRNSYTVDQEGRPVQLTSSYKMNPTSGPTYLQGKAAKKQIWSNVFVSATGPLLMIAAIRPILNNEGNFQGLFASSLMLSDISTFLNDLRFSKSGQSFIMERSGDLVATSTLEIPYIKYDKKPPSRLLAT